MIRYRLPHEWLIDRYFCKWCGASAEAIEDGRKPRYCAKNRRFKAPGMYLSYSSLEKKIIEIGLSLDGIPIQSMLVPLLMPEDPSVGFEAWGFTDIVDAAYAEANAAAVRDGIALMSVAHPHNPRVIESKDIWSFNDTRPSPPLPDLPAYLRDPAKWYLPPTYTLTEEELANIKPGSLAPREGEPEPVLITSRKISAEEHCRWFCAWKGGSPCLADDCPRKR